MCAAGPRGPGSPGHVREIHVAQSRRRHASDSTRSWTPNPQLARLYVLPSRDTYLVLTSRNETAEDTTVARYRPWSPLGSDLCPEINGRIYALDMRTGQPLWPTAAEVTKLCCPLDQPAESPAVVFFQNVQPPSSATSPRPAIKGAVLCMDKRDGRQLLFDDDLAMIRTYAITAQPQEHTITVNSNSKQLVLKFTDEPVEKQPPLQFKAPNRPSPIRCSKWARSPGGSCRSSPSRRTRTALRTPSRHQPPRHRHPLSSPQRKRSSASNMIHQHEESSMTSQAPEGGHLDSTAIRKLGEAREKILGQLSQVIVGQQQVIEELLISPVQPRPLPAGRRAGAGQDADDQHAVADAEPDVQPHPVHARPDAGRHHRHRDHRGEPRDRQRASSASCTGRSSRNVILADEINRTPPKTQAACWRPCRSGR